MTKEAGQPFFPSLCCWQQLTCTLHSAGDPGATKGVNSTGRVTPRDAHGRACYKIKDGSANICFNQPNGTGVSLELYQGSTAGGERGVKHARSRRPLAYQRDKKGRGLQHTRRTQEGVPGASPTHLLMYSALSCSPQVLHLKQPKCQCLSKATRDWPFFISVPQPPQPGKR